MVHVRSVSRRQSFIQTFLQGLSLVAAAIAMTSATVGCGQDASSAAPGSTVAVTALSNCGAGVAYQNAAWNRTPYGQNSYGMNVTPYDHGVRGFQNSHHSIRTDGYCGCVQGTQPMCDSNVGLVCMSIEMLSGADLALWQPGPQGLNFSGYAGYSAYGNIYDPRSHRRPVRRAVSNQCASHVGQICAVGTGACDHGSYCRPLVDNPNLGVCSR